MAALDFPSSPTNGQTFGNWIYNSSKGAWQSKPLTPAKTVNSPTAPSSPSNGDQWFNTNTGQLYIYYTDANSSQWVESVAPITANGYYSPNYIINGGMDIWQRGTSVAISAASMAYTADRWMAWTGPGMATTVSRQVGPTGIQYCARVQRNSGNTATSDYNFSQPVETINSIPLAGKTVTYSFWLRVGANFSASSIQAQLLSGTGTDQNLYVGFTGSANVASSSITPTTSWQRFSLTGIVSSSATQLGVAFKVFGVGTAGANDYFEVTGVQLEEGTVATPFRRNANSIQGELAACQRYFQIWRGGPNGSVVCSGSTYATTGTRLNLPFMIQMRVPPTSFATSAYSELNVEMPGVAFAGAITLIDNFGPTLNGAVFNVAHGAQASFGGNKMVTFNSGVNGFLSVSAEL